MADKKISQLTDGSPLAAGDLIPIARSGANYSIETTDLLAGVSGMNTTPGLVVQTDATTITKRSIAVSGDGLQVSAADGASGNPTLALANDLAALEALTGTGLTLRTATDTYAILGSATGFRNALYNGACNVWQRNTTGDGTVLTRYVADRWNALRDSLVSGMTVSRSTDAPAGFRYSMVIQRDSGDTNTNAMYVQQALETADSIKLAGKQITLSFYAKKGANYAGDCAASIFSGEGTDQSSGTMGGWTNNVNEMAQAFHSSLTTSWQRFEYTDTLSSTLTQLGVRFHRSNITGTAGADDTLYVTGIQLEVSPVATPFEHLPFPTSLQRCQRYYQKSYNQDIFAGAANQQTLTIPCSSATLASGNVLWWVQLFGHMRTAPTVAVYSYNGNSAIVSNGGGTDQAAASGTPGGAKHSGFYIINSSGGAITPSAGAFIANWTATAEL